MSETSIITSSVGVNNLNIVHPKMKIVFELNLVILNL